MRQVGADGCSGMGREGVCDGTGLILRLGYEGWASAPVKLEPSQQLLPCATASSSPAAAESTAPSLSLSLLPEVDAAGGEARALQLQPLPSSPHSTVSSFSGAYPASSVVAAVKREKEAVSEEVEAERGLSCRASDEEEEVGGSARKKLRLNKAQSALLEDMFREHSTLNPKQKQALAKQLNLRPRQVEVWFQNRRARTKLKQTEMDCELLRRCCESLTDENRRLHKELQELKALKFAPSSPAPALYMAQLQPPAPAALSMCPSCERIGGAGPAAAAGEDVTKGGGAAGAPFATAIRPHFYQYPFAANPPPAAC